jgi:hypothetical protein
VTIYIQSGVELGWVQCVGISWGGQKTVTGPETNTLHTVPGAGRLGMHSLTN